MQEKKQEIYKIHCFYMGKIKKNDNLIIKDLMSSYKSRDLGYYIEFNIIEIIHKNKLYIILIKKPYFIGFLDVFLCITFAMI